MLLVVDDHGDTRAALVRLLQMDGYETIGVGTGGDALRFLRTSVPRLVVLDYSMPDMNGMEVFRAMRGDPRLAAVPVVMFSAFDGPKRQEAVGAGVAAYVQKGSLDWAALRQEIGRLAGPADAPTPARHVSPAPPVRGAPDGRMTAG